ncbi:Phenazine biosynthesis-like domain-containing protein 1 [Aphelenchoides besseyi]|nr:Phenazine biosynthesis-like domain-containing protein 1 [Aphelenchoides besseyi]
MQVFLLDNFSPIIFQGKTAAVVLLDKTNEINDDRKQKLASEFKCQTAFPQPIDTDDFLTAKRFKLDVFTENEKLPVCESATLSVVHVLHHSKNPNEEFEFETTIGDVKGRVEKHDFSTLVFPSIEIFSLDSHKQQLTEKLPTIADPKFGKQIADLLPPGVMVNQIVYAPKLKYLLIALDQATSHEQFMSLKLPRDQLLLIDPEGTSVRAVIVTFHYIPNSRSEEVQSVHQLLPLISEPDYVVRVFDWNQSDDYSSSGAAQLVAAPFWSAVYNRTNNLKACQFHPRRAAEFRIELRDEAVEISGQSNVVFNGFISERCIQ